MANVVPVSDPLAWLTDALEPELAKVEASVEHTYSAADRGYLTINRAGKMLQTSYFASFELQSLKDGGLGALEKQKTALLVQVDRLLNPPRPQPMSLGNLSLPRRGRTAAPVKKEAVDATPEVKEETLLVTDAQPIEAEAPTLEAQGAEIPVGG
jgi:hypothetical protein